MAEITKINIKGVDYDIGGTSGGTGVELDIPNIIDITSDTSFNVFVPVDTIIDNVGVIALHFKYSTYTDFSHAISGFTTLNNFEIDEGVFVKKFYLSTSVNFIGQTDSDSLWYCLVALKIIGLTAEQAELSGVGNSAMYIVQGRVMKFVAS